MNTPYIMCAYAAALLLVWAGLQAVGRSVPGLRGVGHLRRFIASDIFAMLLLALRPQLAPVFTVVVANFLLFTGAVFLYLAAAEILKAPKTLLPWAVALCGLSAVPFLWFTYVRMAPALRLEIHCVVVAALFAMTSALLFRHGKGELRAPARGAAWLLAFSTAENLAWGVFALTLKPAVTFVHPDPVDAGFSYLSMILALAAALSVGWLSLCVHRRQLQIVAQTDSLTGLLNRGAFEDILQRDLARAGCAKCALGIMLMDIDYFKQINDEHGHLAGDDVLRRIGQALRWGTRPADVLARFGGEEFVILLRAAAPRETEEVAERLRKDIAAMTDLPGRARLTASFGVAISQPGDTVGSLLMRADEALYKSKREGRNLVRVYGSEQHPALTGS
jgi:diguanylate cyclase (GGDEF)-like protein